MILKGEKERGQRGIAQTKTVYYTNSSYELSSLCLEWIYCNLSILQGRISKFLIYCD